MLRCPKCANRQLRHCLIEPGLPGHSCSACRGALLSLVGYRAWREALGAEPPGLPARSRLKQVDDSSQVLLCPKCARVMTKYRASARAGNRLDYCVSCEEVWLDDGEWTLLRSLALEERVAAILAAPWQRRVREESARAAQAARLQSKLGSDYARAEETRSWLAQHPQRDEILAFLRQR